MESIYTAFAIKMQILLTTSQVQAIISKKVNLYPMDFFSPS